MKIKHCNLFALIFVVLTMYYIINDYYADEFIPLHKDTLNGIEILIAPNLVIQGKDDQNNIWATRGLWTYKKNSGDKFFSRQYHIPTGLSICWLGNFSIIRWFISRNLWVELIPFSDGSSIFVSSNKIWRRSTDGNVTQNFRLKYSLGGVGGTGIGTGFLPSNFLLSKDGRIIFGEYWKNDEQDEVDVYVGSDVGRHWDKAYSFQKGMIRHIHGIKQDSYTDTIWISTGDSEGEVTIFNTSDLKILNVVGKSSQKFRTIDLSFDQGYAYWGTDTEYDSANSGIYRINKKTQFLEKLSDVTGCIYMTTKLDNDVIVMSEAREGGKIEPDDVINLYTIKNGTKVTKIPLDRWKKNILFKTYSWARLARGEGLTDLYLTPLNTHQYDGMLIIIPQTSL